ncbi:Uncharacterised protein [Serratia liquefaciens]|jgi:hypothetical protein|nr:Uncharacterised protein [Serratia liquefaciens]
MQTLPTTACLKNVMAMIGTCFDILMYNALVQQYSIEQSITHLISVDY